ncbi:MAG: ABC transporter substrate-binding protein [Acidimicrobiia bacterium]|nr:ABC transporter substrate-binding protein [Acidimicrobiia bacterium]
MRTTRLARLLAVLLVGSLVVAACGDDGGSTEATGTTAGTSGGTTTTVGGNRASGDPILVGFVNLEESPVASFPEAREAALAAADYVNEELGGVGGRPLELVVCTTTGLPEASEKCANELVEKGVVLVTAGADLGTAVSLPILEAAGIPFVGTAAVNLTEYSAPNSYLFVGGSLVEWLAQDRFVAETLQAKKVAMLHADIPEGALAATTFGKDILTELGVTDVTLVPEDQNAPDFTPALSIVADGDPDAVMVMLAGQACVGVMQAKEALGLEMPFLYSGGCSAAAILEAGGSGAEGDYFSTEMTYYEDTSDEDVAVFREKLDQYGPDEPTLSLLAQIGFSNVMNLWELLNGIDADAVSPESVVTALQATKDQHNFMAHPYTCDRQQVALTPAVCDTHALIYRYEGGAMVDVGGGWISGTDLLG